jgi:lysophospholipase L1-like esterase
MTIQLYIKYESITLDFRADGYILLDGFYPETPDEEMESISNRLNILIKRLSGAGLRSKITTLRLAFKFLFSNQSKSYFLSMGDSKSVNTYQSLLIGDLITATNRRWSESPASIAEGGVGIVDRDGYTGLVNSINDKLAAAVGTPDYILSNLGTNDCVVSGADEAWYHDTWKTGYLYVIDQIHAKWPNARIYLTKVWRRSYGTFCGYMNDVIEEIIAERPPFVFAGDNETVWLENGDDGATYTSDGIHYNAAGETKAAQMKQAAMGY